jgi:hypothetical protein
LYCFIKGVSFASLGLDSFADFLATINYFR